MKTSTLHKLLIRCETSWIRYCVLRDPEPRQNSEPLEVDLLLHQSDLTRFEQLVSGLGFVYWPAPGHYPHRFYISYDEEGDMWLKLDVVTQLRYGYPIRNLQVELTEQLLQRRRQRHGVYHPGPADEWFHLLLHGILDKQIFTIERGRRLRALTKLLARTRMEKAVAADLVARYWPAATDIQSIMNLIINQDWTSLLKWGPAIEQKLRSGQIIAGRIRRLAGHLLRGLSPIGRFFGPSGQAVALLAPDGAGKSSLALALVQEKPLKARWIYMGSNVQARNIGLPSTLWLFRLEKKVKYFSVKKGIHLLQFINRLLEQNYRYLAGLYHNLCGRFVIFDRYIYDEHLVLDLPTLGKRFRRWLLRHAYPAPDLVLLLDAPGHLLYQRKQEFSREQLEQKRQKYLRLSNAVPNCHILDASQTADNVRRQALAVIWKNFSRRQQQRQNQRGKY